LPAVGLVYDPLYLEHDNASHPENAERLRAVVRLLEESSLLSRLRSLAARDATIDELAYIHDRDYVDSVRQAAQRGEVWMDPDTYVCHRSYDAAIRAAGGCLAAVDAILAGEVESAFCLVRPPGHHATPWRAMGFCLFNNIAIAVEHARRRHGLRRVAVVDFDVHHGNGTNDVFYFDPDVLYFSTHEYPFYPGGGYWQETGDGEGKGATVNVPLPAGTGDAVLSRIWKVILAPVLRRFGPEMVLVSAGYDGHFADPLAGLALSAAGYHEMVAGLRDLARELCQGRLLLTLEGGYDLTALPWSIRNSLEALLDEERTPDPLGQRHPPPTGIDELLAAVARIHGLDKPLSF
jgi:acetoin utilization deacetylase AcuC-like enzyme